MLSNQSLNGICPYFTMFPLQFPYGVLSEGARPGEWVCDPFCGRGTTNYASRLLGLPSVGIDSNPVAVAISDAKLATTDAQAILRATKSILSAVPVPTQLPQGEFWELAFHKDVLSTLCRLREGLLANCRSDGRKALRAIILGALHGPMLKTKDSYFSNQSQRTYAPKPAYAVRYWKSHGLVARKVDVIALIAQKAKHYFGGELKPVAGQIISADCRSAHAFSKLSMKFDWIVTSPPYYGMRTYIPDQWLRNWFVGGVSHVDYSNEKQVEHTSPTIFALDLQAVWRNVQMRSNEGAKLVVRFGAINDRKANCLDILEDSFKGTSWRIDKIVSAGDATAGRRQARHFRRMQKPALEEFDIYATLAA